MISQINFILSTFSLLIQTGLYVLGWLQLTMQLVTDDLTLLLLLSTSKLDYRSETPFPWSRVKVQDQALDLCAFLGFYRLLLVPFLKNV